MVLITVLLFSGSIAQENLFAVNIENPIFITDHGTFKQVSYQGTQIIISNSDSLLVKTNFTEMSVPDIKSDEKQIKIKTAGTTYFFTNENSKLNISSIKNIPFYFQDMCNKTFKEKVDLFNSDELQNLVRDFSYENLMDSKSCDEEKSAKLNRSLKLAVTDIKSCLESPENVKLISQSKTSEYMLDNLILKIYQLVLPETTPKALGIKCDKISDKNMGYFKDGNPSLINIDMHKIDNEAKAIAEKAQKQSGGTMIAEFNKAKANLTNEVITEEILHYANANDFNTFKNKICEETIKSKDTEKIKKYKEACANQSAMSDETVTCIQENQIKVIKNVCNSGGSKSEAKDLSDVILNCISENKFEIYKSSDLKLKNKIVDENSNGDSENDLETTTRSGQRVTAENARATSTQQNVKLNSENTGITIKDMPATSSQSFAQLMQRTTLSNKTGQTYQISANSPYGQQVKQVVNDYKKSEYALTTKLNTALSSVQSTALAANSPTGSTKSALSGSRSPASTNTTSEKLSASSLASVTKNSLKASAMKGTEQLNAVNLRTGSAATASQSVNDSAKSATTTNTATPNTTTATAKLNNATTSTADSEPTTNNANTGSSQNRNAGLGISAAGNDGPTRSIASTNPVSNYPGTNSYSLQAGLTKSVQTLKTFTSLTGEKYTQIKKYYSDPQFNEQLKRNRISILMKNNSTNKYINYGYNYKDAEKVFEDNGSILQIKSAQLK